MSSSFNLFFFSGLVSKLTKTTFLILRNNSEAYKAYNELQLFSGPDVEVLYYPSYETGAFEGIAESPDIISERWSVLYKLINNLKPSIVITSYGALLKRIPNVSSVSDKILKFKKNYTIKFDDLHNRLDYLGYIQVEFPTAMGQYTLRGSILDIFPIDSLNPVKIDFFDDSIDEIFIYDIHTQKKQESIESIDILPASDFLISDISLRKFAETALNIGSLKEHILYFGKTAGYGNLSGFFQNHSGVIFDYTNDYDVYVASENHRDLIVEEYELVAKSLPEGVDKTVLQTYHTSDMIIDCIEDKMLKGADIDDSYQLISNLATFVYDKESDFKAVTKGFNILNEYVKSGTTVIGCIESEKQFTLLKRYAQDYSVQVVEIKKIWDAVKGVINIYRKDIEEGFYHRDRNIILFNSQEFFGRRKKAYRGKRDVFETKLSDLDIEDYIVHTDYGVGIYKGVVTQDIGGIRGEYIFIEYAKSEHLYVPIASISLLQKYVSGSYEGKLKPVLNSLNSSAWRKVSVAAKKTAKKLAIDLLKLYAERQQERAERLIEDGYLLGLLESSFEYDETPDQQEAINDILSDMESSIPMERLLCGDVGYGKTEVAMRASCKSVAAGKQVAILAPTTVLARQHYHTFLNRFKGLPVNIDYISRLKPNREIKATIKEVESGKIDIIIGTHRLLSQDVFFKDLGLLVVDEEQRFGVQHKESISNIRNNIHSLAMSATPIPRTMQLTLSGIRSVSILQTPPAKRLPVSISVINSQESVKKAIETEIERGGQVFFLHNDVQSIESTAHTLKQLVPKANIGIAHGQMTPTKLENSLVNFYEGSTDVLVASTVIENGTDISNANTIIINKAQNFGLGQLYQLKGRVGRSHRRGHCYLYVENINNISEISRKRLEIVQKLSGLGNGFKIAMHDLEIRGAGNLLGAEQSGFAVKIGYELFIKLIEDAVSELKGIVSTVKKADLICKLPYYIPASYIEDPKERFEIYDLVSKYIHKAQWYELLENLVDKHGKAPDEVNNLGEVLLLTNIASLLGVKKISIVSSAIKLVFDSDITFNPVDLLNLLETASLPTKPEGEFALTIVTKDLIKLSDIFYEIYEANSQSV